MDSLSSSGFKRFFDSYYNRCFLFARSYVHDDWVAEDVASESLIKLWKIARTREIDNPRILLFTIIKHKALDYLKHEAVKQDALNLLADNQQRELAIRISTLEACEPDRIFEKDIQQIIQTTLASLPEQTRWIFEMNRFQQLSKKEIADRYGITIKGVDYHISKALNILRENLKDYFPLVLFLLF